MTTQGAFTREASANFAEEIKRLGDPKEIARAILVGRQQIELMVQLVNCGVAEVTCCTVSAGPSAGEMSADLVIVPDIDRAPQLTLLLSRVTRALRPDGLLVLCTSTSPSARRMRWVQNVLRQSGFAIGRKRLEPTASYLLCCRKIPVLKIQAA